MSDTSSTPSMVPASADEIDALAAEFILRRRDLDGWNEADQATLDIWLNDSMAHLTSYWRLEAAWERADRLNALQRLSSHEDSSGDNTRSRFYFKIVAAVLVVAAIGIAGISLTTRGNETTYATDVGGRQTITLPDGSRIELNTETELRVQANSSQRTVRLVRGEAFFQIRHDAARPFVVLTDGQRITDLGTKFLVRETGNSVKVAVVEGRARLESTGPTTRRQAITLLPGDEAISTPVALSVTKNSAQDSETELGWRRGVLVFHHAALADVAAEYNRYNRGKIVIQDPSIAALTISATLPTTDIGAFARMAQNFLGLHVVKYGDEVLISR